MNSFYSDKELKDIGFAHIGTDVRISKKASIYEASNISIGNHVRIDDFCILSGKIKLGNYIHISAYSCLFAGDAGIEFEDYVTFSSRGAIYAITDDYSGEYMANPMVPDKYTNVTGKKVILHKHVILGTGCTVLPGVEMGEGASVGCMSLVSKGVDPWGIYYGIPVKRVKERSKNLLNYEAEILKENDENE